MQPPTNHGSSSSKQNLIQTINGEIKGAIEKYLAQEPTKVTVEAQSNLAQHQQLQQSIHDLVRFCESLSPSIDPPHRAVLEVLVQRLQRQAGQQQPPPEAPGQAHSVSGQQ